jgi:CRP-like cAMP-binding protein
LAHPVAVGSFAHPDAGFIGERISMNPPVQRYKNRVLAALPKAEISRLAPHLSRKTTFKQQQTLLDGKAKYAYFLEQGIASVVATVKDGTTVEIGVIGIDGVVGIPILLGTGTAPGRTFIQIEGSGYRIEAQVLKDEFERAGELRQYLQKYIQAFLVQTAQTAVCNRLHNIEERLSRWLLTCRDRTESDRLMLTHDFLGQMLGAPRTTVTLAAGLLHRASLIDYTRGVVTIQNRNGLENTACECYHTVRDEFRRLGLL